MKIYPTKHFIKQLNERYFDLGVILTLISEAIAHPDHNNFEVTCGNATVIAVRHNDNLKLVTGWVGNRQKKQGK